MHWQRGSLREWRLRVFERAAKRLKLSGRMLKVGRAYFLSDRVKDVRGEANACEGTTKLDLVALRALLGARSRAEYIHAIYPFGVVPSDIPPDVPKAIRK